VRYFAAHYKTLIDLKSCWYMDKFSYVFDDGPNRIVNMFHPSILTPK